MKPKVQKYTPVPSLNSIHLSLPKMVFANILIYEYIYNKTLNFMRHKIQLKMARIGAGFISL